ncbi:hypothetical protein PILCRDRAFT_5292 [Piloderma croceum F 1598]|uniref:Uncharacterized protein n=1 Tax=Piloderma croceum (strain F 1598) TaxID=765440 RepID=A0A0C3G1C4_PILCF|nr:hypothetical protein PILCRDRAFT_5292 [Piloderma croceum F 1598]
MPLIRNFEEIAAVIEAIEDRMGPILILVSSDGVCQEVQQIIGNSNKGMTRVESNINNLQSHIDVFKANRAKRLLIVFSKSYTPANPGLTIPDNFIRCEIACCLDSKAHFDHKSTFCGVPFPAWPTSDTIYCHHNLVLCSGVAFVPLASPSPTINQATDVQLILKSLQEGITKAIAAGIRDASHAQIISFALLIISHVRITTDGLYISTRSCVTVASEVAAAAFVYFISWETIAYGLLTAWDSVVSLLTRLWEFIKTSLDQIFSAIRRFVSKLFGGSNGAGGQECVPMKALKAL